LIWPRQSPSVHPTGSATATIAPLPNQVTATRHLHHPAAPVAQLPAQTCLITNPQRPRSRYRARNLQSPFQHQRHPHLHHLNSHGSDPRFPFFATIRTPIPDTISNAEHPRLHLLVKDPCLDLDLEALMEIQRPCRGGICLDAAHAGTLTSLPSPMRW
jgi:hypothetical protein